MSSTCEPLSLYFIDAYADDLFTVYRCWTDNRDNKLVYFKDCGLWFLPDKPAECAQPDAIKNWAIRNINSKTSILDKCCQASVLWPPPPTNETAEYIKWTTKDHSKKDNKKNKKKDSSKK